MVCAAFLSLACLPQESMDIIQQLLCLNLLGTVVKLMLSMQKVQGSILGISRKLPYTKMRPLVSLD